MKRDTCTCASCAKFPLQALQTSGKGFCSGYEREVNWNDRATVLYIRAKDIAQRRPLVAKLMQEEKPLHSSN